MQNEIIIAGFGGQGILSMGKVLAYAGLLEGKEVSWFPSYGPEQRGGTANVTIILSKKRISSPILNECDIAVLLNQPSLDKFEQTVKPNGTLIYDKYGITRFPIRQDIRIVAINAMNTVIKTGNIKIFNMIVLGILIQITQVVTLKNAMDGLKKSFPNKRSNEFFLINQQAILKGMRLAVEIQK